MKNRWKKMKDGFVAGKTDWMGILTLSISCVIELAWFVYAFARVFYSYDLPIFSFVILHLYRWLDSLLPLAEAVLAPFAIILAFSMGGRILSGLVKPRNARKWEVLLLYNGAIYSTLDLPCLLIARYYHSPLLHGNYFWLQLLFDVLYLLFNILAIRIWKNSKQ